jgi:hypothetical protein
MTAEDVKFSIERIQDPKTASFQRQQMSIVQAVETPDPASRCIGKARPAPEVIAELWGAETAEFLRRGRIRARRRVRRARKS